MHEQPPRAPTALHHAARLDSSQQRALPHLREPIILLSHSSPRGALASDKHMPARMHAGDALRPSGSTELTVWTVRSGSNPEPEVRGYSPDTAAGPSAAGMSRGVRRGVSM